jgi:hypothetical protein
MWYRVTIPWGSKGQKCFGTINFCRMSQDVGKLRCRIAQVPLYMFNIVFFSCFSGVLWVGLKLFNVTLNIISVISCHGGVNRSTTDLSQVNDLV